MASKTRGPRPAETYRGMRKRALPRGAAKALKADRLPGETRKQAEKRRAMAAPVTKDGVP